jgi:hypothetical protein
MSAACARATNNKPIEQTSAIRLQFDLFITLSRWRQASHHRREKQICLVILHAGVFDATSIVVSVTKDLGCTSRRMAALRQERKLVDLGGPRSFSEAVSALARLCWIDAESVSPASTMSPFGRPSKTRKPHWIESATVSPPKRWRTGCGNTIARLRCRLGALQAFPEVTAEWGAHKLLEGPDARLRSLAGQRVGRCNPMVDQARPRILREGFSAYRACLITKILMIPN